MTTETRIEIALAEASDVPLMLAISNQAAETSAANFATEPESVESWLGSFEQTQAAYPWLVARDGTPGVIGFAKGSPHRARGAYATTAEVSVYVDAGARGRGIGAALYRRLIPTMRAQGYVMLLAGIALPNAGSERLHTAFGFVRCGTFHRAGWKLGAWHDVGYWELDLRPAEQRDLPPREIKSVREVW